MTANLTRRTALAGAAAGTLIPVAGLAQAATTANATDAVWPEYLAAKAAADDMDRDRTLDDEELIAGICRRLNAAEDAVLEAPVATLTDVERKLAIYSNWNGANDIEPWRIDAMHAQVRSATGRAA